MDYFTEAFGEFSAHDDPDIAAKFATNIIFMDERFAELACLLTDGHEIGGIEGEPGWILERRDALPFSNDAWFGKWPAGAVFRAYVEPNAFELGHAEAFLSRDGFHALVFQLMRVVAAKAPDNAALADIAAVLSAQEALKNKDDNKRQKE